MDLLLCELMASNLDCFETKVAVIRLFLSLGNLSVFIVGIQDGTFWSYIDWEIQSSWGRECRHTYKYTQTLHACDVLMTPIFPPLCVCMCVYIFVPVCDCMCARTRWEHRLAPSGKVCFQVMLRQRGWWEKYRKRKEEPVNCLKLARVWPK